MSNHKARHTFHTITSHDWKHQIKRARVTPNKISQKLKELVDERSEQILYHNAVHSDMFEYLGGGSMRRIHGLAEDEIT